jgi:hypothetical protein
MASGSRGWELVEAKRLYRWWSIRAEAVIESEVDEDMEEMRRGVVFVAEEGAS